MFVSNLDGDWKEGGMPIVLVMEKELVVGTPIVIEGPALEGRYSVVFEDDGDTAYFYALDMSKTEQPIQDAMHIYNVMQVGDRARPSIVKIGWSDDGKSAVLLINGYPHAVFDFNVRQGYCRTGFPPSDSSGNWSRDGHKWDDLALELFS
jgi:hypothetical protein